MLLVPVLRAAPIIADCRKQAIDSNPLNSLKHKRASTPLAYDLVTNQTVTPWLTSREAASYLKVEHRTLLAWAREGKVKGHVLSGVRRHVWRFRTIDLDARMEVPPVLTVEAE